MNLSKNDATSKPQMLIIQWDVLLTNARTAVQQAGSAFELGKLGKYYAGVQFPGKPDILPANEISFKGLRKNKVEPGPLSPLIST